MNLLNYFATSILKGILQVVISTGVLKCFAQVSISILTQVQNSYLSLLKEKTNISKKCDKFNKTNKRKTRLIILINFSFRWNMDFKHENFELG